MDICIECSLEIDAYDVHRQGRSEDSMHAACCEQNGLCSPEGFSRMVRRWRMDGSDTIPMFDTAYFDGRVEDLPD